MLINTKKDVKIISTKKHKVNSNTGGITMKEYNGYTMSTIMKGAWKLARRGAKKFGGSAREYFAESLKTVWARV